jgi:hypothetical protein
MTTTSTTMGLIRSCRASRDDPSTRWLAATDEQGQAGGGEEDLDEHGGSHGSTVDVAA